MMMVPKCIPGQRLWQRSNYSGEIAYEIDMKSVRLSMNAADRAKQVIMMLVFRRTDIDCRNAD